MNLTTAIEKPVRAGSFPKITVLIFFLFLSNYSFADTHVFKNVASTYWSNPANWTPSAVPEPGDSVIVNTGETLTLDGDVSIHTMTLMAGAQMNGLYTMTVSNSFHWDGSIEDCTIEISNALVLANNSARSLINGIIQVSGTVNWSQGNLGLGAGSTLRITSTGVLNALHTADFTSGSASSAVLEIEGSFVKNQSSATTLNCQLQLTGNLSVLVGLIYSMGGGNITGEVNISNEAYFDVAGGEIDFDMDSEVVGTGGFRVSGGTANFNIGSGITCDITLSGGFLFDHAGLVIPNLTQSGTSEFGGTSPSDITSTYTWQAGTVSGTKTVSGTANLSTTGTKTVSGSFTISGTSTWSEGRINVTTGGHFIVATGSSLLINHTSNTQLGSAATGVIEINGTVTKADNTTTTIRSTFNTLTGGVLAVAAGSMQCATGSSGNHSGAIQITAGANFDVNRGTHNFNNGAEASGAGIFRLTNNCAVLFNTGSEMTANLEITHTSSRYTDNASTNPSSITLSNGTLDGAGSTVCTGSMAWSGGTIGGSNSLTVNGTTTFSGTTRNLTGKTLDLVGNGDWTSGNFVFASSCTLMVNTTSLLLFSHTTNQEVTGTGLWYNLGVVRKTNASSITTIGVSSMNAGRFEGVGTINFTAMDNQEVFAPGISGTGALSVNTFDNANAKLEVEIQSNGGPGTGHDVLQVSGDADLGGQLDVTLLSGFEPNIGDSYQILNATSVNGTLTANLPPLSAGKQWEQEYAANSVTLKVTALLPVELFRFNANAVKDKVSLTWQTASETNNKGFEIQRSLDGSNWRSIGFVNGGGTTNSTRTYSYADYPEPGMVFYRLRQIDWDGNFDLSNVVQTRVDDDGSYRFAEVSPNPVINKEVNVIFPNGLDVIAFYQITDAAGQVVQQGAIEPAEGRFTTKIDVKRLSSRGIYVLMVSSGNSQQSIKFVIE